MNHKKAEDLVFETTAGFALFVAATAITVLLYQLITTAVPLLQSPVFQQVQW
jgi:hypothetical protein